MKTSIAESGAPAASLVDLRLSLGSGATRVDVLKGITLNFERGKATAIIGPSGCGKSTLLMALAGLERVDSGSITIAGQQIESLDEDALATFRREKVGIVFQSFHLMPTMTALENVAIPLELAGVEDPFGRATCRWKWLDLPRAHHIIPLNSQVANSSAWP